MILYEKKYFLCCDIVALKKNNNNNFKRFVLKKDDLGLCKTLAALAES